MQSPRVKLPLPMGAMSERDLISAVPGFTPAYLYPMMPHFAHLYHGQLQYGARALPNGVNFYPSVMPGSAHYDHERDTEGAPVSPVFDSVGFHSSRDVNQRPPRPPAQQPGTQPGAPNSDTASTSSATSAGTFRLGPKGSIIKT
jgi:hypothetical protein